MSIFDGLRQQGISPETAYYNDALHDVQWVLSNPTPAMMFDLRRVVYGALADASIPATMDREAFVARAVLTFLAGGDQ